MGDAPTPADMRRYRENWQDEVDGAAVYRAMADGEDDERLARVYLRLAEVEERHAEFWAERLREAGHDGAPPRPGWRARILALVARRFGPGLVSATVASSEAKNQRMYDDQPEAAGTSLPQDERSHARVLATLVRPASGGLPGPALARLEGRHRSAVSGNALRAAVLGANDGLVSNLSLVMGVAGAAVDRSGIVIAGLAGLIAGSVSMALGEWISVQSSREAAEHQLAVEARELAEIPDEEQEELALIFEAKGLEPEDAREAAEQLFAQDDDVVLGVLAREELGIDPEDLGGSPWHAAWASFVLFALGAAVPVAPFLFTSGSAAIALAAVFSGVALYVLGAGITLITARSAWRSGVRQLGFGLGAAVVTFGVGSVIGITVA